MKNARRSPWRFLFKFHRYAGLCIAIIVLMLSVTGIMLNHTSDFRLDQHFVKSPAILDWYGIEVSEITVSFALKQHWLAQSNQQLYLDKQAVFKTDQRLIGAIMNDSFITAAFNNYLLLLTPEGTVIEKVPKPSIQRIGSANNDRIYIESDGIVYLSDDQLLSWQVAKHPPQQWSSPAPLPNYLTNHLTQLSRQSILPYERVMLDIHSGRFFGPYGIYIIDLSGGLLILVTISGTWIWLRHKIKQKHNLKHRTKL